MLQMQYIIVKCRPWVWSTFDTPWRTWMQLKNCCWHVGVYWNTNFRRTWNVHRTIEKVMQNAYPCHTFSATSAKSGQLSLSWHGQKRACYAMTKMFVRLVSYMHRANVAHCVVCARSAVHVLRHAERMQRLSTSAHHVYTSQMHAQRSQKCVTRSRVPLAVRCLPLKKLASLPPTWASTNQLLLSRATI